jgi:excisionase family DNA binding protein
MDEPAETTERYLDVGEVAKVLGVTEMTVYRWARRGQLPARRFGRSLRFLLSDCDAAARLREMATRPARGE